MRPAGPLRSPTHLTAGRMGLLANVPRLVSNKWKGGPPIPEASPRPTRGLLPWGVAKREYPLPFLLRKLETTYRCSLIEAEHQW